MDYQAELSTHSTLQEAFRSEERDTIKTNNYWAQAAKIADALADRMQDLRRRGEEIEEIELREFHGLAIPELRRIAERWRQKGSKGKK